MALTRAKKLFVLLHGEVQGPPVADFNARMFTCNYRIKDRYKAQVVSLGVVTGGTKKTMLGRYETELWGCRTVFEFPVVRMSDWRGREGDLEASRNPFAMVVLVHLALPRARRSLEKKYNLKRDLMRRLLQHGFEADSIRSLLRFMDWVIRLPEGLEQILATEIIEFAFDGDGAAPDVDEHLARVQSDPGSPYAIDHWRRPLL